LKSETTKKLATSSSTSKHSIFTSTPFFYFLGFFLGDLGAFLFLGEVSFWGKVFWDIFWKMSFGDLWGDLLGDLWGGFWGDLWGDLWEDFLGDL